MIIITVPGNIFNFKIYINLIYRLYLQGKGYDN